MVRETPTPTSTLTPTPSPSPASSADTRDHGSQLAGRQYPPKVSGQGKRNAKRFLFRAMYNMHSTRNWFAWPEMVPMRGRRERRQRKRGLCGVVQALSEPSVGFFFPHSIALGFEMGQFSDKHWVETLSNQIRNLEHDKHYKR